MQEKKGLGVYNVVIIGADTAGLVAPAGTAGLGGRVALIERNKMGGDCLNYGCVPSKALIASALAMKHRIGLSQLAATIHVYPTFAELGRKVGDRYSKKRLTPFLKNAFTWLYQRSRGAAGFTFPRVEAAPDVFSGKGD
jgi:cation diffusion facilitator CzcD-associated flavoprotein CzcO